MLHDVTFRGVLKGRVNRSSVCCVSLQSACRFLHTFLVCSLEAAAQSVAVINLPHAAVFSHVLSRCARLLRWLWRTGAQLQPSVLCIYIRRLSRMFCSDLLPGSVRTGLFGLSKVLKKVGQRSLYFGLQYPRANPDSWMKSRGFICNIGLPGLLTVCKPGLY